MNMKKVGESLCVCPSIYVNNDDDPDDEKNWRILMCFAVSIDINNKDEKSGSIRVLPPLLM